MARKPSSVCGSYPEAFSKRNEHNKAATVERVRLAIANLLERGVDCIDLRMIHDETRAIDPSRPPVAMSTISRNSEAYALYEAVMSENFKARKRRNVQRRGGAARARLMRRSKMALTDGIVILAEQIKDLKLINETLVEEISRSRS